MDPFSCYAEVKWKAIKYVFISVLRTLCVNKILNKSSEIRNFFFCYCPNPDSVKEIQDKSNSFKEFCKMLDS